MLALTLAACGSSSSKGSSNTSSGSGGSTGSTSAQVSGTLNGSGSTFQQIFEQSLITGFRSVQSGATVTYDGTGSTAGKTALANGTADFAGTDSPVKSTETAQYKGKALLYFPIVGGPIAVAYNVSGVKNLKLSAATLANIFQAKITKWNASAIAADNPGVSLPSTNITVVHRSDGSGTTSNFTKYLAAAAPTDFTLTPGETVSWPSGTVGAAKNPGVAQAVTKTDGAIGYVDYSTAVADKLNMASIKNSAGDFVAPTLAGSTAALDAATINDDLTFSPLNEAGATTYPITSPTWILVYKNQSDATKAAVLKAYLAYALGAGQQLAAQSYYSALPQSLDQKAVAQINQITVGS
ncbi:MAG TPA: phosphate ABC transporter substrate-binding protein PstS [Acidimicrobiia bacterium]